MTRLSWAAATPSILSRTIFSLLLGSSASLAAANAAENPGPDELVVSAMRIPTPRAETGSTVSVIDAETIQLRQYAFAAEALRDAAGVSLARNGGDGAASSIRIRGAASGQTLVILDGAVVNDTAAPQGGYNFANLDASNIDRIEILRGPQSLLYGADAIGGVIVITSKKDDGADIYFEGGSRNTLRGGLSAGIASDDAYGRFSLNAARTDGVSRAADGDEKDGHKFVDASFAGGTNLSQHWSVETVLRATRAKADIDGFPPPLFSLGDTAETEKTKSYLAAGKLRQTFGHYNGALSLSYAKTDRKSEDSEIETFSSDGKRFTADYIAAINITETLRIIGGGEWEKTWAVTSGVDESATAGAGFIVAEASPIDALTLSAGARRDEFSNFDGATTARAAAVWRFDETTRLRASWGEGFRAPSLFELNYDQFGIMPNPDLRPERASGFDLGLDREFDGGHVAVTLFHTKVTDQIDFDLAGNGYFNIASARSRGVELEGAMQLTPAITIDATYSFTDAVNKATGAQLLRQPKHKGTLTLSVTPLENLTLAASTLFNGRENDTPAPNDGFIRLDLRAAYAFSDSLELYGRIENATDADYQDVSGYGEPGLSAFAGIRARL